MATYSSKTFRHTNPSGISLTLTNDFRIRYRNEIYTFTHTFRRGSLIPASSFDEHWRRSRRSVAVMDRVYESDERQVLPGFGTISAVAQDHLLFAEGNTLLVRTGRYTYSPYSKGPSNSDALRGRGPRHWFVGPQPLRVCACIQTSDQENAVDQAFVPPSTVRFAPVMYEDSGPATNATNAATSPTVP